MLMPQKFNEGFTFQWSDEGLKDMDFTPFDRKWIVRKELKCELRKKIINPLMLLMMKHRILKGILISKEEPSNRVLYNLMEDAARQNITAFYDLMGKFIDVLELYKNNYSPLFNKSSQKKLFKALVLLVIPNQSQKCSEFCNYIEQKRKELFIRFDDNGRVDKVAWENLINNMRTIRDEIKSYRDKVASHADEELVHLRWDKVTTKIESFFTFVCDINTILTFSYLADALTHDLVNIDQNINSMHSIIFKTNEKV
ncbi:MAG: hypothetical protein ACOYT8_00915 [Candidatus Dependentiae bacterium]